jgi:hypothetical protein
MRQSRNECVFDAYVETVDEVGRATKIVGYSIRSVADFLLTTDSGWVASGWVIWLLRQLAGLLRLVAGLLTLIFFVDWLVDDLPCASPSYILDIIKTHRAFVLTFFII